jgi:hypothetical protein
VEHDQAWNPHDLGFNEAPAYSHSAPLYKRHRHVADDHLVLPKASFELGASITPIRQVDLLHHHLEDNNFVLSDSAPCRHIPSAGA